MVKTLRHLYGAAAQAASHTIHIEVPPNRFGISRTVCYTTLAWLRCTMREPGFGYLNQSFQNAVRDGIRYGLEQGLVRLERNGL